MTMKSTACALALFLISVLPAAAQPAADDPAFGEIIDVRVINLEVVVTDRKARVMGLASDDFQKDYDHLVEHGVEFMAAPFGESPQRFAYGRDPFGNVFELLEHAEGDTGLRYDD